MNTATNRVTIGSICEDLLPFTEKGNKVIPIEIVPRKMVEMIIEQCKKDMCSAKNDGAMCYEASCIKDYAESLLEQFEEG